MRKLFIKPQARLDLLEIWLFIANDSVPAAIKVGEDLENAIRVVHGRRNFRKLFRKRA